LGGRWGPTWSLDVEEAFYFLLTGFFVFAVRYDKLSLRLLTGIYIALVVVGIIERGINNIMHPAFAYPLHFTQTHLRLDALFFGVLLAYLYHFKREQLFGFLKKYKKIIIPLIVVMIIPNFLFIRDNNWWISVILLATNPVAYGCILLLALNSNLSLFNNKILSFIGRHSYAIYLWHPFINVYANHYLNTSRAGFLVYVFIYLIISITTGYIMTKLIEEPFLRIREQIYPSKSKAPIILTT
jgi:peptidoglycan/LPS O-acetylase OafA/YrhL